MSNPADLVVEVGETEAPTRPVTTSTASSPSTHVREIAYTDYGRPIHTNNLSIRIETTSCPGTSNIRHPRASVQPPQQPPIGTGRPKPTSRHPYPAINPTPSLPPSSSLSGSSSSDDISPFNDQDLRLLGAGPLSPDSKLVMARLDLLNDLPHNTLAPHALQRRISASDGTIMPSSQGGAFFHPSTVRPRSQSHLSYLKPAATPAERAAQRARVGKRAVKDIDQSEAQSRLRRRLKIRTRAAIAASSARLAEQQMLMVRLTSLHVGGNAATNGDMSRIARPADNTLSQAQEMTIATIQDDANPGGFTKNARLPGS